MGIRRSEELVQSTFKTDEKGNPTGGTTLLKVREPGKQLPLWIDWQDGIVGDKGQTGAFVEDVIEAARQRLIFFQQTEFNCKENAVAITKLEEALQWLDWRTRQRLVQGVENTYELHRGNGVV